MGSSTSADSAPVSAMFFDADGTKFRWHSMPTLYNDLLRESGSLKMDDELYARLQAYRNREGSFQEYEIAVVPLFQQLLQGQKVCDVQQVAERLVVRQLKRVHVFTRELFAVARALRIPCFLVSGGPAPVIAEFARRLGFDDYLATEYPHEGGIYTGGPPKQWVSRKDEAVRALAEIHGLDLQASVAIGDTTSDVPMLASVRWPICFNPTRDLYRNAEERGWPVVMERKNLILSVVRGSDGGPRAVTDVYDVLPQPIASMLDEHLDRAYPFSGARLYV